MPYIRISKRRGKRWPLTMLNDRTFGACLDAPLLFNALAPTPTFISSLSDLPKANLIAPDPPPSFRFGRRARQGRAPRAPACRSRSDLHPLRSLLHIKSASSTPSARRRARAFGAENAPLERFRGASPAAPHPNCHPAPCHVARSLARALQSAMIPKIGG